MKGVDFPAQRGFLAGGLVRMDHPFPSSLIECRYCLAERGFRIRGVFAHHQHFYMESERFRMSLLAGCVPIKVVPPDQVVPPGLVFGGLVLSETDVAQRLHAFDFRAIRRRFRDDFRGLPGLSESLATFLRKRGILPSDAESSENVRVAA